MKFLLIFFLLFPIISYSQVRDVFEIQSQDVLSFESGHFIKIPANRSEFQHDYLIELDTSYTLSKITLDRVQSNMEFYGYLSWETQHGEFNLIFISNSIDQIYQCNHQVRYILVRSSGTLSTALNLDLDLK